MRALPTGTVTFFFTDIEGSTRLLQRLGERYPDVKGRHDAILRTAIAEGGGTELGTEGDSFFAVFPSPVDAVMAAINAQRALAEPGWPDGVAVRVRMGLHTGEGILAGDNYLGLDVNRAARIAAAAHGGQLLVSDATRCLVEHAAPSGTHLRDLGRHSLKDLLEPERLYQVVVDGLEQDFPALRTLDVRPNNLPAQMTRLIGRREEISKVRELLATTRLVTLTGTGGTGKTRLALAVAAEAIDDFDDGVFFVDLAPVGDSDVVPTAIAGALHVRGEPGRPIPEAVADHLRDRELLLVIDNFEHVLDAAPLVLEPLLRQAPRVTALVTSRIPLRLYGEHQFQVPPLPVPTRDLEVGADMAELPAVALFAERAAAVKSSFRVTETNAQAIAEITARLDGLPLAIELAASRIRLLAPEQLLKRLEQRLTLLSAVDRNVPERQRTVRRTIDWSYELLAPNERRMFSRFAVFAGGADLEAVEAIVNPNGELDVDTLDGLAALVGNNLVQTVGTSDTLRFGMLETIREYGLERLAEDAEEHAVRSRHAQHWVEVAGRAAKQLAGSDQAAWIRRLELEHDNFRAALSWAARSGEAKVGLQLATALEHFWRIAGPIEEGLRSFEALLALPETASDAAVRARALAAAGGLAPWIGAIDRQIRYAQDAADLYRSLGDSGGSAHALAVVGWAHLHMGNFPEARGKLEEAKSFTDSSETLEWAANCDLGLGALALAEQRVGAALTHLEDAYRGYGLLDDPYWLAFTEMLLGSACRLEGDLGAAEENWRSSLRGFHANGALMMAASVLNAFADLALQRGQHERALRLAGASDVHREPFGDKSPLERASTVDVRGALHSAVDDAEAEKLYAEGRAMELDDAIEYALQDDATEA